MKENKNRAITLIALIITIIILLILAGITIITLTGENGLIKKAIESKSKTENSTEEEKSTLQDYENKIDEAFTSEVKYVPLNISNYTGLYDGNEHQAIVTSDLNDVKLEFGTEENLYTLNTMPTYINSGIYTIYYKATHPNYESAIGSVTVTIEKLESTISVDTSNGYIEVTTNSNGTVNATSSDVSIINNVSINGNIIKVLPTKFGSAGTATMTITIAEAENYKEVSTTQSVTVSDRLIPSTTGWWVPSGSYAYGYLDSTGRYTTDADSMWRTTGDITISESGFYYILGYSGAKPRFCLYNVANSNGTNLYKALTTTDGYAVTIPGTKYLKISVCVGAGQNLANCDLRKITFN